MIGSETVAIAESDASNTQTITLSATFGNLANGKLYGNAVKVTARVTNPSKDNSFASKLNCSLRTYNSAEDEVGDYAYATVKSKNISINKSGSTDVEFEFDGLEQGKFYCLRFTYVQGYTEDGTQKTHTQQALITERYQMDGGYKIYNVDGTYTLAPTASEIDAEDARCVDLTPFGSLDGISITPSSNPNCLYILPTKAEAPSSLSGRNVVCDGSTSALNLSDGYDFFTPISFIAENVSYTRTFTLAAGGTQGWNTIFLPFAVETITVDDGSVGGKEVDWFHSSEDTGKNFWLREFTSDSEGTVVFDFAKAMKAYTPYIIAVPGDTWGDEWRMTGRAVTFSGSNAKITATADASVSGNHYAFCGNTQATHQSDIYVLNDKGSRFSKAASATDIAPFRAWFSPISISSLSLASLSIGSPTPTSLWLNPINAAPVSEWYTMDGRKLQGKPQRKGMYIQSSGNSSRKVMIK